MSDKSSRQIQWEDQVIETRKQIKYVCNGHPHPSNPILRTGCGEDLSGFFHSLPLDGKEGEYRCPKCGEVHIYRSPIYPGDDVSLD